MIAGTTASARASSSAAVSSWTGWPMYSIRQPGMASSRACSMASSANGVVAMPTAGIPRRSR